MSSNPSQINELYEFGPFRLDLLAHLLFREGVPVPLAPKSYDVLVYLVKNPGRAISREDLLTAVWPDTVVSDASLTQAVFLLRKALGDGDEGWIETVPKVGYRFKDAVRQIDRSVETAPAAAEARLEPVAPIGLSRRRLLAGSALGLLGVGAAAVIFRSRRPAVPQSRPATPPPSSLLRVERELRLPPDAERVLGTTEGTLVFSAPGAYYLQPLDGAVPASRLPLAARERVADRLVEDDLVVVSGTSVLRRHALKQTDRTLGTVPAEAAANVTRVLVSDSGRHLVLAGPAAVFVFALPQPPDLELSGRQLTPSDQLRPGVLPGEVLAVSDLFLARAAGAGAPLRVFELASGKPVLEAPFAELEPHHVAIDDASGRIAVSGAFDSIALFSVEKGAQPERIPRRGWTHGMAFVPDVPTLVVSGYGGLSAHRDRPVAELPGVATAGSVTVASGGIYVHSVRSQTVTVLEYAGLPPDETLSPSKTVLWALATDERGGRLFAGGRDGHLYTVDLATRTVAQDDVHTDGIPGMRRQGAFLATSSDDKTVGLWEIGKEPHPKLVRRTNAHAFLVNDLFVVKPPNAPAECVTASSDGTLKRWSWPSFEPLETIDVAARLGTGEKSLHAVWASPSGDRILSGSWNHALIEAKRAGKGWNITARPFRSRALYRFVPLPARNALLMVGIYPHAVYYLDLESGECPELPAFGLPVFWADGRETGSGDLSEVVAVGDGGLLRYTFRSGPSPGRVSWTVSSHRQSKAALLTVALLPNRDVWAGTQQGQLLRFAAGRLDGPPLAQGTL